MEAEEAWALFTSPRAAPRSSAGERVLERADAVQVEYRGERLDQGRVLQAYEWGERSAPLVFLAHGWGGSAGQMSLFVDPLLAAGYRVLAIEPPAHGHSEGARTQIYEFLGVLEELVEREGALHAVVGHSLGGAAATIGARRGLALGRVALLAPTARLADEVEKFARRVGLSEAETLALRALMQERRPAVWHETELANLAPEISGVPALVIHDEHDPEVPYADSQRLAATWSAGARFHGTAGLGHVALLRNADVAQRVAEFVTGSGVSSFDRS